ncbi:MAG: T9SS type A sorting domain-containing protein, partial [Fibrobacteres bacterium]|nr:T9SS type A sorting domain-containing protein [Fibrobacterota bacterium]
VNYSCVKEWNQRIQKTANHYNTANTIPCFTDIYNDSANTHTLVWNGQTHYGVAVEWQIDLCNRVGADLWINIPATATSDFERQLALLIKAQLDTSLKVYVEWANEVWNWNFSSTVYARNMADSLRLDTLNYGGAYMLPWRAYTVYASVRAFEQFENVFGKNSPRIVKVIAGQVGYHWNGYDYNHMVNGDLAALNNRIVNPNSVSIDAYAMAPYMGGSTIAAQRAALSGDAQYMRWAKNSLNGTSIKLICYEAGADNYPDQTLVLTRDIAQEQLNFDYLAMLDDYCQGPVNQYCMYGGCWGLKNYPGESEANAPKWRGWLNYWGGFSVKSEEPGRTALMSSPSSPSGFSPNPVSGCLNIVLRKHETADLRIIDIKGRVLIRKRIIGGTNRISLLQYPTGVYILEIDKKATITREKLVVL